MAQSIPHSAFRIPHSPRSGLSLTEVLISMGILTLGLLGVASVFPVGSFYMQKAEISDKASAIAQSVMSDIMARGMLNPRSWYVMVPYQANTTTPTSPNFFYSGIDGKYSPVAPDTNGSKTASTFTRPFAEALSEGLKRTADPVVLAKQFGSAYVIDPMFVAAAAATVPNGSGAVAYPFPAAAFSAIPSTSSYYYYTAGWTPWQLANKTSGEETWPIRRVTLELPNGWPLDKTMAESYFRSNDDLSVDFPARDDRPAMQTWDTTTPTGGGTLPLGRKFAGEYSWIVTVVPTTNAARDGMVRNPEGFAYDVSVVVFHKRSLPTTIPATNPDYMDAMNTERMVGAKIISTGMNGGEILLADMSDVKDSNNKSVSPFAQLRSGQWIMLCGPHPNSSTTEPRFVLNWYQVISIEGREARLNAQGTTDPAPAATEPERRLVTVRGPEWPWQPKLAYPSGQQSSATAMLSDDLCVGIFRGAAAVHTKSIRLESPSATGTAALTIPKSTTPPPYDAR